jgi:hypothetical protein
MLRSMRGYYYYGLLLHALISARNMRSAMRCSSVVDAVTPVTLMFSKHALILCIIALYALPQLLKKLLR